MKRFLTKLKKFDIKKSLKPEILKNSWGGIGILILVVIIGIVNYKSGTILTGWDNLHPEFNLWLNIKRSIFAVWQEYQSLGLLGGMGHASDLMRQIILLAISPIIPMEMMRYTATIATLLIGSLGAYALIKTFIANNLKQKEIVAFMGGTFYLLNIATIQTYFVAFEAFTSHYAALPWLLYGALKFINEKSAKSLVIFSIILLLATPSGYIPTLFVVFLIALFIILFGQFIFTSEKIEFVKRSIKTFLLIFLINAFWLLPFLYFTLTSAGVTVEAKMNQMATDNIFLQNKEFGGALDVMQLKGFWFNNVEPNLNRDFAFMLAPWKEHFSHPAVITASFLIFAVILVGLIYAVKNKRPVHLSFALLFLFTFTMLATNTPPFSWLVDLFREIPLFSQAFRFPFTKFSILAALSYSVFFSLGTYALFSLIKKHAGKLSNLGFLIGILLIAITSFPVFKGDLFYEKEQLSLPEEYYDTLEFFDNQDPNTRIATLPMHTFWGWNYYEWGYSGSGFWWYGIEQPIIDRAFDVWSKTSENSYFELSNAIYSKDTERIVNTLEKYQTTWLLVDKNIYSPSSPRSLFHNESEELFAQIPSITKDKSFGKIDIYKVDLENKTQDFLLSKGTLPSINSYVHSNRDAMSDFYTQQNTTTTHYPFRTLFTGKQQEDMEFNVEKTDNSMFFKGTLPNNLNGRSLDIPSLLNEQYVFSELVVERDADGTLVVSLNVLPPKITIGSEVVSESSSTLYPLFIVPNADSDYTISINNSEFNIGAILPQKERTVLSLTQSNYIYMVNRDNDTSQVQIIEPEFLNSLSELKPQNITLSNRFEGEEITIEIPKITDSTNGFNLALNQYDSAKDCNNFRNGTSSLEENGSSLNLSALNDSICISYYLPSLSHELGYLVDVEAQNLEGMPFHFWTLNTTQQYGILDTYLKSEKDSYNYILPPRDQHGQGYSFHFDSVSVGSSKASNNLDRLAVHPIPFSYLEDLKITSEYEANDNLLSFDSEHPNESLYVVKNITAEKNSEATLILSQSYHKGWKAYQLDSDNPNLIGKLLPFLYGKEIDSHTKVNNWQNGWIVNNPSDLKDKSIVIVFLPQYLEYLGFVLLIATFTVVLGRNKAYLVNNRFKRVNSFFELRSEVLKSKIVNARTANNQLNNFPYSIDLSDKRKYWNN